MLQRMRPSRQGKGSRLTERRWFSGQSRSSIGRLHKIEAAASIVKAIAECNTMASGLLAEPRTALAKPFALKVIARGEQGEEMAATPEAPKMKATLGLTGVTVNAMALIAPGAFLWITFVIQAGYVYPSALSMWAGIFAAILLAYATAISYAEMAKLFPGAGSSYLFAEQAFLNTTHAYKFARIAKFVIGWASHLYYWVYPGVMVATMGIMIGYIVGTLFPDSMNSAIPGPIFMALIAVIFSYAVAYIAFRGVSGSTAVALIINIIQIVALLFFAALAISYRAGHPAGSIGLALDSSGNTVKQALHYTLGGDNPSHPSALS